MIIRSSGGRKWGKTLANEQAHQFYELTQEVFAERLHQDQRWGGPVHDDQHTPEEWIHLLDHQTTEADYAMLPCGDGLPEYRVRLIKIAALAFAALEALDRAGKSR